MSDRPKVFVCHSSLDKPFVHDLCQRLRDGDVDVWLDEMEIHVGESLIQRIGEGIKECDLLLAVISRASVDSSWVQKELSLAMTKEIHGRKIVVLPLMLEECRVPYFLTDKLYADFRDPQGFADEFGRLSDSIQHHIARRDSGLGSRNADPPHTDDRIGRVDVGSLVHDRGEGFLGHRAARSHRRWGIAVSFQGPMFGLLSAIPAFVFQDRPMALLLLFFGFFVTVGGTMLILSASFLQRSYDENRRILLEIEAIGEYRLPFDGRWWRQYEAGKRNRAHQIGMALEAGSQFVLALDILMLVVLFPRMM